MNSLSRLPAFPAADARPPALSFPRQNPRPTGPTPCRRLAALLLCALTLAGVATNAPAEESRAHIGVIAYVAMFFRFQLHHQVESLTVTAQDVKRGYVDLPTGSFFSVKTNAPDGYVIEFVPQGELFRSVQVSGLQGPLVLGAQGGSASENAVPGRVASHQLGYRFLLRPEVMPGNYPWPLAITVRAA